MKLNKIFVQNLLAQNAVSVTPDTILTNALQLMSQKQISCLLVADEGRPIGILTERDIVKIANRFVDVKSKEVREEMSSPVITIAEDANILDAYGMLRSKKIRHLVLVDTDGIAKGVVTQTDIINELSSRLSQTQSVTDVMTKNIFTVKPDEKLIDIVSLMAEKSISCVIVQDGTKPVGLLTERDVAGLLSSGLDFSSESVEAWMSTPVNFIDPSSPLVDAVNMMGQKKHRRFLVMDKDGRVSGLITQTDIVKGLLEGEYINNLREEIAIKDSALQKNEERYRLLVDGVRIIGWEYDPAIESFTFVSGKAEEITGYKPGMWYMKGFWLDHIHVDDREPALKHYEEAVENTQNLEFEYRMVTDSGGIIWLRNVVDVVVQEGKPTTLRGVLFDITAEKRLQQQVIQASKLSSIGTFVAGVAHELNNPLTSVILYADTLVLDSEGLSEDMVKGLNIVKKQSIRASNIVKNLLKFSRKFEPGKSHCNLNWVLEDTIQLHAYHVKADNIEITSSFDVKVPEILADLNQLQQVFSNIIINACQAMIAASFKGEIRVSSEYKEDKVIIAIENDGPTIPEDKLGSIFDPFFTTKEVGEGTGLGLSIAYGIIEEHGGSMLAENIGDSAVRFVISLPTESEDIQAEVVDVVIDSKAIDIKGVKILLVDDEEDIADVVSRNLAQKDAIVKIASNGKEAIAYLDHEDFDIILSDIKMPVMNGVELGNWLYKNKPHYLNRFVLVTGSIDMTVENYCLQHGCRQLVKPFKMDELISIIYEVVSGT